MVYGMKDWLDAIVIRENSILSRLLFLEHCKKITSMLKQSSEQRINKKGLDELVVNALVSFKNGPATTVVPIKLAESDCILKRYNARSAIHVVSRALRQTRAMRCWQRSYDFAKAGINVATPIMMYEQRIGPIRLDAYFVCDKLEGDELLGLLPMMSLAQQQSVLTQMKDAFKKMRAAKLTHGDMKATNIMWVDGELFFIDLDAARKHRFMSTWRRSHVKDVKRFMKNWKDQPQLLALFNELYDS